MSTSLKKTVKSKFPTAEFDELIEHTEIMKASVISKKAPKRARASTEEEEENSSLQINFNLVASAKKKKEDLNTGGTRDLVQGKLLEVLKTQFKSRKRLNDNIMKNLSELTASMEADYSMQKNNNQKLQQLTAAVIKCNEQAALSQEQKLKSLNEIHTEFKKRTEAMDSVHKKEAEKLAVDLENDIEQLEQKLIAETKRNGWETLRKTIFQAMKSDFD